MYLSTNVLIKEHLDTLSETAGAAEVAGYTEQAEVLYKLELIWHLAEILIIDPKSGKSILRVVISCKNLYIQG